MTDRPGLQDTSAPGRTSTQACGLALAVLEGEVTAEAAVEQAAGHFLAAAGVESVVSALTSVTPADTACWLPLGGRAWIREWRSRTAPPTLRSVVPSTGAGPDAALTMPWVSQIARAEGFVALADRELLPPAGEKDRAELTRLGIRSLVTSVLSADGSIYGSLALTSSRPGPWPDEVLADFRLLNSAISARIALEQSRRALAGAIEARSATQLAFQRFFGAVGHELRTPVSAILGYAEVLVDEATQAPDDAVSAALLRDGPVIVRAGERLLEIVDSLLGAGRTLAGEEERQEVVVADAVADAVHWHRTPAGTAGVDVEATVDPAVTVWAHPSGGVRQVLSHLLGNAIAHHRPEGGRVQVTAEVLGAESGGRAVRVVVRDDGPGMDPAQLAQVFEPFVRLDHEGPAGSSAPGSGLGLSLARMVAERDGGSVQGESVPGSGSSFWVELPATGA